MGHHTGTWKRAKRVMLPKPNMLDYTTVKSYHVISRLNCLGSVCKKVVDDMLSEWCEVNHILHKCQMDFWKNRSTIVVISWVVSRKEEVLPEGKLKCTLLMNVKSIFDHVSRSCLSRTMECMAADGDLMQ